MTQETQDGRQTLMAMIHGNWITRCVYVFAVLGIADELQDGPRTAEDLATATSVHPRALYRLLRALAGLGIVHQEADGRFTLTSLGEGLRTDAPDSLRAYAMMVNGPEGYRSWGALDYSIKTGKAAFEHVFGGTFLDHVRQDAAFGSLFNQSMTEKYRGAVDTILEAWDFSPYRKILDVGGGYGHLLLAVLRRYPNATGAVFDLPSVAAGTRSHIDSAGLAGRCSVIAGDAFAGLPEGYDAYLMKSFINNWDDADAIAVLRNCRNAMPSNARLLIIEPVLRPANEPDYGKLMDLQLLVLQRSGERERADFEHLLRSSRFALLSVVPTASEFSILEVAPQ